ncbi:hypothetical protein HDA32_000091 [Spinactinospora alkalitolerans]|uniref:Uncharacterized protein n=1 Tax=Spinactinospora alkalitolerans TaxID=687207 RepID=A0A852TNG3_9ACTN|nr:hypothetical protein [Spinactinospora alkalitolerans]NYE44971.1 hypothetical protein [Spinactinospora alkalitolerans]
MTVDGADGMAVDGAAGGRPGRWSAALDRAADNEKARRRWAARGRRRVLVAVTAACMALTVGGLALGPPVGMAVFVAAGLPMCYLASQVNLATRLVTERSEAGLDEREISQRRRAGTVSHRVTTVVLLVLWFVGMALWAQGGAVPIEAAVPVLGALVFLHASFPAAYLAWTLPDDPLDDDEA